MNSMLSSLIWHLNQKKEKYNFHYSRKYFKRERQREAFKDFVILAYFTKSNTDELSKKMSVLSCSKSDQDNYEPELKLSVNFSSFFTP